MTKQPSIPITVIVTEDDDGHAKLIERNLRRVGIDNDLIRFSDGAELLDFLYRRGAGPHREADAGYLLLLDIQMPRVDGVEVLRQIKADPELKPLPVIMLTTTDDPREIERCHDLGCSCYVTKPIEYDQFVDRLRRLGMFIRIVQVPTLKG